MWLLCGGIFLIYGFIFVNSETFTSSANLKQLWENEQLILDKIENYLNNERNRINTVRRLADNIRHRRKNLNEEEKNFQKYVTNPLNAYQVISEWTSLFAVLSSFDNYKALTADIPLDMIPTPEDYHGSADAIIRLQHVYRLSTLDLVQGKVLGRLGAKLNGSHFWDLGKAAMRAKDIKLSLEWLEEAEKANDSTVPLIDLYLDMAHIYYMVFDYEGAVNATMKAYEIAPLNTTVNARLWFFREQQERRATLTAHQKHSPRTWSRDAYTSATTQQYEALCRGDEGMRPAAVLARLKCYLRPSSVPYYLTKEEVLNIDPRISLIHDVISQRESDTIRDLALPSLKRAMVGDPQRSQLTQGRISKLSWLWDNDINRTVPKISRRVQQITGLSTNYKESLSDAEPLQVVNYGIGGQYEPHTDFYPSVEHLKTLPAYILNTGDRIATFMFYLTDVEYGGRTVFPKVNVSVPPIKNAAAFWYNLRKNGDRDIRAEHAGCPVLLGEKWVANKWIREAGQLFRRPCGLSPDTLDYL